MCGCSKKNSFTWPDSSSANGSSQSGAQPYSNGTHLAPGDSTSFSGGSTTADTVSYGGGESSGPTLQITRSQVGQTVRRVMGQGLTVTTSRSQAERRRYQLFGAPIVTRTSTRNDALIIAVLSRARAEGVH